MDDKKFAILIDSDNVSHKYIKIIVDEITTVGIPTIKRIYGDWTSGKPHWKNVLLEYALTPMQQYSYTTGKNSTDSAMIIDAMDILYTGNVDGFCIASSDSDFTKLATRLREAGKIVIGMGEKHTPQPFVKACSQFKYLDLIAANNSEKAPKTAAKNSKTTKKAATENTDNTIAKTEKSKENANNTSTKKKKSRAKSNAKEAASETKPIANEATVQSAEIAPAVEIKTTEVTIPETPVDIVNDLESQSSATPIEEIEKAILAIIEDSDEESGLILASKVGTILQNRFSDFDVRNYGCKKMTDLLKKLKIPTVKYNDPNNPVPNAALLYIKVK